jgi:hypothetical protein
MKSYDFSKLLLVLQVKFGMRTHTKRNLEACEIVPISHAFKYRNLSYEGKYKLCLRPDSEEYYNLYLIILKKIDNKSSINKNPLVIEKFSKL